MKKLECKEGCITGRSEIKMRSSELSFNLSAPSLKVTRNWLIWNNFSSFHILYSIMLDPKW